MDKKEEIIYYILSLKERKERRKLAKKFKIPWECIMIMKEKILNRQTDKQIKRKK